LPSELKRLAWLSLDSQEGQEYWNAMELMGRYAAANHACIHQHIAENLGAQVLLDLENHHNFAWKERHVIGGVEREVIVHRKGATPAGAGVLGIIPGSMATPGFVVSGKGNAESLNSASHGAGRAMSRKAANEKFNWKDVNRLLRERGVTLISRRSRRSADGLQKHPRSHGRAKRFGHGAGPVRSQAGEDGPQRRAPGGLTGLGTSIFGVEAPGGKMGFPPWAAARRTAPVVAWAVNPPPLPDQAAACAAQAPGVLKSVFEAANAAACWVAGVGFCVQALAACMAWKSVVCAGFATFSALAAAHLTAAGSGSPCANDFTASEESCCLFNAWDC
jgi:hypothetical protein